MHTTCVFNKRLYLNPPSPSEKRLCGLGTNWSGRENRTTCVWSPLKFRSLLQTGPADRHCQIFRRSREEKKKRKTQRNAWARGGKIGPCGRFRRPLKHFAPLRKAIVLRSRLLFLDACSWERPGSLNGIFGLAIFALDARVMDRPVQKIGRDKGNGTCCSF